MAALPVLNMPDMLRDPVAALAGREVPVTVLQQEAISFLHSCLVCLSPAPARWKSNGFVRGTPAAVSEPTLLFHASNRQPPCGTAVTRGHVYWASRSAALYAQQHACERCFAHACTCDWPTRRSVRRRVCIHRHVASGRRACSGAGKAASDARALPIRSRCCAILKVGAPAGAFYRGAVEAAHVPGR